MRMIASYIPAYMILNLYMYRHASISTVNQHVLARCPPRLELTWQRWPSLFVQVGRTNAPRLEESVVRYGTRLHCAVSIVAAALRVVSQYTAAITGSFWTKGTGATCHRRSVSWKWLRSAGAPTSDRDPPLCIRAAATRAMERHPLCSNSSRNWVMRPSMRERRPSPIHRHKNPATKNYSLAFPNRAPSIARPT